MRLRILSTLCIAVLTLGHNASLAESPRNIILMIGDGMGVGQVTAGHTYKGSLALEEFKVLGLVLTQAHGDDYVTDSAAAATAMASGVMTYNGAIGVAPDKTARETAMERAQKRGMKTGIVATCSITHATPACFVSHIDSRRKQIEIAEQIAQGSTDLYLGTGWGWFLPRSKMGKRTDGKNLIEVMQRNGYTYVSTPREFQALDMMNSGKILGLFDYDYPGWAQDRDPSLPALTRGALSFLSSGENGFFLMIEGSQIDWAGHEKDSKQIAIEMIDFDDAIAEVLRFAKDNPETLVIVTADHETGGYALVDGSIDKQRVSGRFVTDAHTGTMIPLFAMGPGAERFAGIQHNTNIGKQLLELLE